MEFRELRSLCLLAESGNLSETARALHLTPAAVHKQLKVLEAELRTPLYERKGGRLRMTAAAGLLLPYLRDILGQYDSALGALDEWKGVRRGLLRVGAGPSLATYLLPPILKRYQQVFPKVELDVQTGSSVQLVSGIAAGSLDLALVVAPESMEEPSCRVVMEATSEIVLVSRRPETPKRLSLAGLKRLPFLLFRRGARIENLIEHYFAEHGFVPDVMMRFDSAEALKAVLLEGIGYSMLPLYTVEDAIKRGRLKRVCQKEPPLLMKIHLLGRHSGYVPPAVTEFVRMAGAWFA